jgi:hypothetical protein
MDEKLAKNFGESFGKFISISILLMKCATQKCSMQTNKAYANKELIEKYNQFKIEQDKTKKLKIFGELNNNTIMYDLNTCAIKNCKKQVKDIIKIFKSFILIIPKTSPKYDKMHKIVSEIESIINSKTLTEKEYKNYIKNINDFMTTIN